MWIDIVFLLMAGYAFYRGYQAGIIRVVLLGVSVLIALLLAMRFAGPVTVLLQDLFRSDHSLFFLGGFLLTFLIVIGLIRWTGGLLEKGLGAVRLNVVNKGVGGLLFATGATLILSTLLGLLDKADIIPQEAKRHSMTWGLLATVPEQAVRAYEGVRPILADFWDETRDAIESNHEEGFSSGSQ